MVFPHLLTSIASASVDAGAETEYRLGVLGWPGRGVDFGIASWRSAKRDSRVSRVSRRWRGCGPEAGSRPEEEAGPGPGGESPTLSLAGAGLAARSVDPRSRFASPRCETVPSLKRRYIGCVASFGKVHGGAAGYLSGLTKMSGALMPLVEECAPAGAQRGAGTFVGAWL